MSIVSLEPKNSRVDRWTRAADLPQLNTSDELSAGEVVETIRRNAGLILGITAAFLLGALLLNSILPQSFQAQTRILIDPRGLQVVDKNVAPGPGGNDLNQTLVESEMQIIKSDAVLGQVVKKLDLTWDAEFNGNETGILAPLADFIRGKLPKPVSADEREAHTMGNLRAAIEVDRATNSFIVDVYATSREPAKAQLIANSIASEYIAERVKSRSSKAARGSLELSASLVQLRRRLEASEQAVEEYKKENDIVDAAGQLVNEQQLAELNTQLGAARGESTRARARLEQIKRLRQNGIGAESTLGAVQSPIVANLRGRLADIRRREAALSISLLPSHPRMREIRNERRSATRQLSEELNRIAVTARLDAERAEANVKTLTANLKKQKSIAAATNRKSIKLRELEREAEANRSVYNSFLTRSRELSEQTRVDSSVAEVISPAARPDRPERSKPILLLLSTLAGLATGLGVAFLADATDRHLRTARQLSALTGIKRVFEVPKLTDSVLPKKGLFGGMRQRRAIRKQTAPLLPAFYETSPDAPASQAMAAIAADLRSQLAGDPNPSVLLTAVEHDEAKSTVALNIALAAADAGNSVLLIDADFDRKCISRCVDAIKRPGLLNVLDGSARLAGTIMTDTEFPFAVLPVGNRRIRTRQTGESRAVTRRILDMTNNFDLVIIDDGLLRNKQSVATWSSVANTVLSCCTRRHDQQGRPSQFDQGYWRRYPFSLQRHPRD